MNIVNMDLIIPMVMICAMFLVFFSLFLGYNRSLNKAYSK